MKIVLYANRNVGLCALSYLVAKKHNVIVVSEDDSLNKMAQWLGTYFGGLDYVLDNCDFDLFLCVHGRKIIPQEKLKDRKMVNVHPTKYNGHNPVKKYIGNKDTVGTLRAMYMTEVVDGGEVIAEETFETGECKTYADFYNVAIPYYFKIIDRVLKIVS